MVLTTDQDHKMVTQDIQGAPAPTQECNTCYEKFEKTYAAPCGHYYCIPDLCKHAKHSMEQESTFPASCCGQEFPHDKMIGLLAPHIRLPYKAAAEEFSVPSAERIFCSGGCGSFLGSSSGVDTLTCSKCELKTCTKCKHAEHSGDCVADDASLQTLVQAQGWQTCGGCKSIVQLNDGCNHITCRCGHQFCYVCGLPWKTCDCQQYGPNRPQQVPDDEGGNWPYPAQEARCDQHDWYAVPSRRQCETCRRRRHQWRCRRCTIVSCAECRYPGDAFGLWF